MQPISRVVIAVGFALASILAVMHFEISESDRTLRGATEFVIDDFDRSMTSDEIYAVVRKVAVDEEVNIYKLGFGDDSNDRLFFKFIGNPLEHESLAPGGHYADFDARRNTRFLSQDEISTQDVRGRYVISGDEERIVSSLGSLRATGFALTRWRDSGEADIWIELQRTSLPALFLVVVFCCILIIAYTVIRSAKEFSIKGLHGYGLRRIVGADVLIVFVVGLLSSLGATTATVGYLHWYNDWERLPEFVPRLLGVHLVLLLFLVVAKSVAVSIVVYGQPLRVFDGAPSDIKFLRFAYVAKCLAIAGLLMLMADSVTVLGSLDDAKRVADRWQALPNYLAVSYSSGMPVGDNPEVVRRDSEFRAAFAGLESRDRAFLASSQVIRSREASHADEAPVDLIVDNNFLERECVADTAGFCVRNLSGGEGRATLLVPEHLRVYRDEIVNDYQKWLAFQGKLQNAPSGYSQASISVEYTRVGQEVFSYRLTSPISAGHVNDPVILVADAGSGLLSDNFYASVSSSAGVLFTDKELLEADLDRTGVGPLVQYVYSVKHLSMQEVSDLRQTGRTQAASLALTALVAIVVSAFVASMYCSRHRKRIYLEEIHGYSFLRRHLAIASGLTYGGAVVVSGVVLVGPGSVSSGPLLAVAVVSVDVLITLGFITVYETRAHRTWLKRA